jgi:hypothetical protein
MKKPVIATLGIVAVSLAVIHDLQSHAQTAPAAIGGSFTQNAAPVVLSPSTLPVVDGNVGSAANVGAGQPTGPGNAEGGGFSTGPGPSPGGGAGIGIGPSSGIAPSSGAGLPTGVAPPIGPGASSGAGLPTGVAPPVGVGPVQSRDLLLRGQVSNVAPFTTVGPLATNPNMQIVRNAAGQFFIMSPNGLLNPIAPGVAVQTLIGTGFGGFTPITTSGTQLTQLQRQGMFNSRMRAIDMSPLTLIRTQPGILQPTAVASREVFINQRMTTVTGEIVAEYPERQVQQFARVIPKETQMQAPARKQAARKQTSVYLK